MSDVFVRVEMEFDGFLNGWTDITDDIVVEDGIHWDRGLPGETVHDCVAKVGIASFSLHNSAENSLGLAGAYTFGHANQRAGFEKNTAVQISIVIDGEVYSHWVGRLRKADAAPGMAGARISKCVAMDYMYQCARKSLSTIEIQQEILDSDAFAMIVAAMPVQPRALNVGTGFDTLPYVFHHLKTEKAKATSEFQKICQTTLAKVFVSKNGTLTYEPRSVRARNITTNVVTITEDDVEPFDALEVVDDRDDVINSVQVTLHPPTVDGEEVVLFSMPRVVQISANQPLPLRGLYTEPGQRAFRAGGLDMIEPDLYLGDYEFNTASDGSGLDVSDQVTIDTTFTATSALFVITAPVNCYMLSLQVRGIGVFDNATAVIPATDDDSIDDFGENSLSLDMKYASDAAFGDEVARYLLSLAQQNAKRVRSVNFLLNGLSTERAKIIANRDISDRIGFVDAMSALPTTTSSGFNINAVSGSQQGREVRLRWSMGPSDSTQYWLLEIQGRSELDQTTRLGFSLIVGHTDVNHGDSHDDVTHVDVAHGDSHTDSVHEDSAHVDAGHSDVAHSDVAHSDTAHSDTAHSDTHDDVWFDDSHADSAHRDSHGDSNVHFDSHDDAGLHSDHTDHTDVHQDDAHADGHVDIPHTDAHSDAGHTDVAHSDVNHSDTAHTDSSHNDSAHGDTAHGDVAHSDSLHDDVPHDDDHDDIDHGDQN